MKKNMSVIENIETLSNEDVFSKVDWPLLKKQLQFAKKNSSFWQEWFTKNNINIDEIKKLSDYQQLPLLDKHELLEDQSTTSPYGNLLSVDMSQIARVHRTSGSSAHPLMVLLTQNDIQNTLKAGQRAFNCAGMTKDDIVFHCLNYCMWSGGITDHQCMEKTGATIVPFGIGNSTYLIQSILRMKPTGISCTPSYFFRLEELLWDEFQLEPKDLGVEKAFFGGESGLQDKKYRDSLEKKWNVKAIDSNYGMSEVLSILGSECEYRKGLHFHGQGIVMPELIDQKGNSVEIRKGNSGELVLSCLLREGQPLFRYRTHDAVEIIESDRCECGRRGFIFKVIGRTDDMIVVKGINFFPNSLQGTLAQFTTSLSGEFRVIVFSKKSKLLLLQVELAISSIEDREKIALIESLKRAISNNHSVKMDIEILSKNSIEKTEGKTRRIIHK